MPEAPVYNDKQVMLMLSMLKDLASQGPLKCNWETVAAESGYASAHTAACIWSNIKLKMQAAAAAADGSPAPVKTPRKRKNNDSAESPSYAKKARSKKAAKAVEVEYGVEEISVKAEPVESTQS